MSILTYLHLFTPLLLAPPVLSLFPAPTSPKPELPGIIPITIRRITPRRGFILTLLSLIAFTFVLDTIILIIELATVQQGDEAIYSGLPLIAELLFALGGFVIWGLTAVVVEWRGKWGNGGVVALGSIGLVCEIPILVFTVLREVHTESPFRLFNILSIVPSALRVLHLPILLVVTLSPIIRYEPADERTGLLTDSDSNTDPEPSSSSANREAYGTFTSTSTSKPSQPTTAAVTGSNTPTATDGSKGPHIPKNLGEIKKDEKAMEWKEVMARLRKLAPNLWPSTSVKLQIYCVLCLLILAAGRVLQPLQPLALGQVVRSFTNLGSGLSPWIPFIGYFAIRLLTAGSGLLSFAQQRLWVPVSQFTDREMQMLCFNHLLNLSLAYHTKRNTGEVLKIIDRGSAINNLFQTVIFTALPTIFDIVIAFGIFFYLYGGILALTTVVIMVLYVYISVYATQQRVATRRQLVDKDVKQRGILSDVLTNWESVKYFTAESRESKRFREAVVSYQETEMKFQLDFQLLYLIQSFLLLLGLLSGSLIIALRVLHGQADAAEFVVFIQYFQQLSSPLNQLGWLYAQLNRNSIDAEKMFTLLAQVTEVNDKPGAKDLVVTDGIVEFQNVEFSYDGKVPALKGVSFTIGKGQSMALVGESGSGKSTILRLLYRFYDINSGRILIDGQDISQVTQISLRRAIGIVPQDSVLWNDSIGANISYGKEGAGDEEIIEAAKAARLHERIMGFAEQYETVVGERGVRLSGGEKQRVSLARMFLKSPAILVLDEATSALDTETEREIQKALSELAKGRSSLSIAHRLSTIINSDQIVVMKDGGVIEHGSYKELLDLDGVFAGMWKKQIFTEAEIVAQAAGEDVNEVVKNLPEEMDQIEENKDDDAPGGGDVPEPKGGSSGTSSGDTAANDEEGNVGFAVVPPAPIEHATEDINAVEAGASQGEDVKGSNGQTPAQPDKTENVEGEPSGEALGSHDNEPSVATDTTAKPAEEANAETSSVPQVSYDDAVAMMSAPIAPELTQVPPPITEDPASSTASPAPTPAVAAQPSSSRATPEKTTFPPLPRMSTSTSTHSNLSEVDDPSSPSASASELPSDTGTPGDKRRKRLSSIKGFVRRISDQGVGRSKSGSGAKSPMSEVDEATALLINASEEEGKGDKVKKRLSLKRGD